ncbi:hypothetical protein SAMN02745157_0666 [Kaistia soli DSM 19436]|uniref:Uncharacterized protein n=1 Tax=Kaistia soli DSM 19436 TaxID=1122133 RepID=A0A1M4VCF9_9HYPH|nr:hypothetical protein [Kaistia soli]SHE66548.1 hypothetical protein SAMN02745157_0666 [Kaistia soli DSM 19436]
MIKLGNKVRDLVTGFTGIATARTEYLYGCVHISVTPTVDKDGKQAETAWFDEQRVEVVEDTPAPMAKSYSATSGGPADPPRNPNTPPRL